MAALEIRKDRTPTVLRKLAKAEADTRVARRILAIANALDGMSREQAARSAGMDRQTLRDWVQRYNEQGIDGLADRGGDGLPPTFDAQEQAELMHIVLDGLIRASGLGLRSRFGHHLRGASAADHPWSLGRLLKRLGFSATGARAIRKDPAAWAAFSDAAEKYSVRIKKAHPPLLQDEARIGQKAHVRLVEARRASAGALHKRFVRHLRGRRAGHRQRLCARPAVRECQAMQVFLDRFAATIGDEHVAWCSIKPAGTVPARCAFPTTSRWCRCRPTRPS